MKHFDIPALIQRCARVDDAARAEFVAQYDDLIRRAATRKIRELCSDPGMIGESDDICNDVYLHLFKEDCKALRSLRNPRSIDAWLMTVTQNMVRSHLRKRSIRLTSERSSMSGTPAAYEGGPERDAISSERRTLLETILNAMPPNDRLILQLYYLHRLKYAEIAEILSLNINTVATRLLRARKKLRKKLGIIVR